MNKFVARLGAQSWLWLLVALAVVGGDLWHHLLVGWVPHDEGMLAVTGNFVRRGLWPHRDFIDTYSGGLAVLTALAQAAFGDTLRSIRYVLFGATLGWVVVAFSLLRRALPPMGACLAVIVGGLWGPALYSAALPTWFLMMFGTAIVWTLFAWQQTHHRRWLFVTGVLIGLSVLIKINGIFFLAAVACALASDGVFDQTAKGGVHGSGLVRAAIVLGGVACAALLINRGWKLEHELSLLLPLGSLAIAATRNTRSDGDSLSAAIKVWLRWSAPLFGGLLLVLGPWVLAYVVTGGAQKLWTGLFVLPFRRVDAAAQLPPAADWVHLPLFVGTLVATRLTWPRASVKAIAALLVTVAVVVVAAVRLRDAQLVIASWRSVRIIASAVLVGAAWPSGDESFAGRQLRSAAWVAAWFALTQYPFSAPIYLAYTLPLTVIVGALFLAQSTVPRLVTSGLGVALIVITLGLNHGQSLGTLGGKWEPEPAHEKLTSRHGGLWVFPNEVRDYLGVANQLDNWGSQRMVAVADCPEVSYLTNRPYFGKAVFEFLDPSWSVTSLMKLLDETHADAMVWNQSPSFSMLPGQELVGQMTGRVIEQHDIGRFTVFRLRPAPEKRDAHAPP